MAWRCALVDRALGGQLGRATSGPSATTLRDLTRRYSRVSPPGLLVLDFLQNDELDRPITRGQEAFLPELLEAQLDAFRVVRPGGSPVPAVRRRWVACEGRGANEPTEPLGLLLVLGRPWAAVGLRWSWTLLAASSVLAARLKALPAFDQDDWNVLALLLPLNAGLAAAAWLLASSPRR